MSKQGADELLHQDGEGRVVSAVRVALSDRKDGRRKSTLAAFGADRRRHMDQIGCNTGDDAKLESAAARTGLGIAAVQPRASRGT
jgi:hypothetical protein